LRDIQENWTQFITRDMSVEKNILALSPLSSNTGYAWQTIRTNFIILNEMFQGRKKVYVGYRRVNLESSDSADSQVLPTLQFDSSQYSLWNFIYFWKLIKNKKISYLYACDYPCSSIWYIVAKFAGVKRIVCHIHHHIEMTKTSLLRRFFRHFKNTVPFYCGDIVIAISNYQLNAVTQHLFIPSEKTVLIHNGVETHKFSPERVTQRPLDISWGEFNVICAARANYYKGIDVYIKAASKIVKKIKDIRFLYCGDGPDIADFRNLVLSLGLENAFSFLGYRTDYATILKFCDLAVCPSVWEEPFGLTVIEAMASGVPVIASSVGGIPDIITGGVDGVLIVPKNEDVLADEILRLYEDIPLRQRLGKAGTENVQRRFDIRVQAKRISLFFE